MTTEAKPKETEALTITTTEGEVIQAKPTTDKINVGGQEVAVSAEFLAVLKATGINWENVNAPQPVSSLALNPEQLCNLPTRFPGAEHESSVMVLITVEERMDFEVNKPYKGLLIAYVAHPIFGPIVLRTAHSKFNDDGEAILQPVTHHLLNVVKSGDAFKLATFKTKHPNPVVKPIPVA